METKKEFHIFSIFNHQKEEKYLSEMHSNGWRFVKVTGLGVYHFEKCAPEDVVYQLDYNPQKDKNPEEYKKMFADCGWEHIQDYTGYSYFRKPASQMNGTREEIFNDDSSKTAMMGRVYKSRILPLFTLFCCCLLPQFVLGIINSNYIVTAIYGCILVIYIVLFAACAISYWRMKNK